MKYVLIILFVFGCNHLFAQKKIIKETGYSYIGKLDTVKRNFLMPYSLDKTYNAAPSKTFKVVQAFYSSSTIWDESRIILVDSTRFYCSSKSCLSNFYCVGYYRREGNGIVLLPEAKVAKELPAWAAYAFTDLQYNPIPKTYFKLVYNTLIYQKEQVE